MPPRPETNGTPTASHDWDRYGRHRFRAPAAVVIDDPLIPSSTWLATIWPEHRVEGGWARILWHPDPPPGRGWSLPDRLALGDVIEFGGDDANGIRRWYGIVDSYEVNAWLTVQGPYPDPGAAHRDAERLLADQRYLPPLDTDPHPTATRPCARRPRPRGRHP